MIKIRVKGQATDNQPRFVKTKSHDEIWLPDTPLGRIIAERLEKQNWKKIKND